MKYYIIAGEASGDLHGSRLVRAIYAQDAAAHIRAWGGDMMQEAGADVVKHIRDLAFMGFAEVLKHLGTILNNISWCKKDIAAFTPDVLVLVDYPGFNLRIATWARAQGFRVVYYIAPQVWAWKENRVPAMKKSINKMLVILPFEKKYFQDKWSWDVDYVGHPLVEAVSNFRPKVNALSSRPIIALLPGSRKQEIQLKLPVMLAAASAFKEYQIVVAKAPAIHDAFYQQIMQQFPDAVSVKNLTYELLSQAKAALVTSGTATLETALFGVPQAVCYKGNAISYAIAKRLVKVKYISLVNLIMDRLIVKEFIQREMNVDALQQELQRLLHGENYVAEMKRHYAQLKELLAADGQASHLAAKEVVILASGKL